MTTKTKTKFPKKVKIIEVEDDINIPPYDPTKATKPVAKKITNPFTSNINNRSKPTMYILNKKKKGKNGKQQFPVVYMIKSEDVIFDPIKGVNRKIRYIPGESSIYEDEQKKRC